MTYPFLYLKNVEAGMIKSLNQKAKEVFESLGGIENLFAQLNEEVTTEDFIFLLDQSGKPYFIYINCDSDMFGESGIL